MNDGTLLDWCYPCPALNTSEDTPRPLPISVGFEGLKADNDVKEDRRKGG